MEEAEKLYKSGLVHLRGGSLEEAISLFKAALAIDSKDPYYHNDLCSAYIRLGQLDEALQECELALGLDPDHKNAIKNKLTLLKIMEVFNTGDLILEVNTIKEIVERSIGFLGIFDTGHALALIFKDYGQKISCSPHSPDPKTAYLIIEYHIAIPSQSDLMYIALKTDQGWIITASVDVPATQPLIIFSTVADEAVNNSILLIRTATNRPSLVLDFKKMIFLGSNTNHKVFESEMGIIDSITTREDDGNRGVIKFRDTGKTFNYYQYLPSGRVEFSIDHEGNPINKKSNKPWYQFWYRDRG